MNTNTTETEMEAPFLGSETTSSFSDGPYASAAKKGLLDYYIVSRIQPGSGMGGAPV